ncbi:NAD-dependent dehydratase [candidate division WOR-1 bacterium RIFOXYC2_FULL_37_10]|uniref:NAD-dependent dehydratase n=1 Tax=candidate division WOR-1 bacterium RIFOXYB2_FULL_37_13 TaxID=1802579 RepID=A0A1F4SQ37_UNCSA|nr:MAG: NAD-dependent dehydratase [candidate division WOR-1 bacterium RIFOXYB2_FULL_37_13]OGC33373.1 MAG: NAD-dependent dehydratase [candidate division WOR-1 bacterium RIFOXYC2_FULL_37_10]
MVKILITGGNGFIARNLFEQLKDDYTIISCSSNELDLLDYLNVFEYIKKNQFDIVLHSSTYDPAPKYSTKDPAKVLENNLRMFFNLARCKDFFGKMIYFGSGAEFGREKWIPRMKEEYFDKYVPSDQYGFSKYLMNKYAQLNSNIYNLRVFSVFGKYEDWRYRFISKACCCAIMDLPIIINQNVVYDFLYIDDLARIVKWFIENKMREQAYNVCSGQALDFKTLAEKVVGISGKKLKIIIKSETTREYSGDNSRLMAELKDFKFSPIDESINSLYQWYSANQHVIEKSELI